ncbi:MAG: hypothetical protein HQL52_01965 [Magnetococcales bacterium]|nr:hypothetical protein [Magnetococcales bacterium]
MGRAVMAFSGKDLLNLITPQEMGKALDWHEIQALYGLWFEISHFSPPKNKMLLFSDGRRVWLGQVNDQAEVMGILPTVPLQEDSIIEPSHWLPLPDIPQDEADQGAKKGSIFGRVQEVNFFKYWR